MKITAITAVLIACALTAGCRDEPSNNAAGLTEETYKASGASRLPITFPGQGATVFKEYGMFKDKQLPKAYSHPNTWVVYMASPGWTNAGKPIADRLAIDAVAISKVKTFVQRNHLRDQVKVAWLQYDRNPDPLYLEGLDRVPDNIIPLFLKPHGPQVDYYIYSPAVRNGHSSPSMRYDEWLKPYLSFAKKDGSKYVASTDLQRTQGFNEADGQYWDRWARHWFVVNPEGIVVDAYFSNLGNYYIQGPEKPINSLIHHLALDPEALDIPKIIPTPFYESLYSEPYWDKLDKEFRDTLGVDGM